jgi:ferredoxin
MFSLEKKKLEEILSEWAENYELYVPCEVGNITSFEIYGGGKLSPDFRNSRVPPLKKIMIPQTENLYSYKATNDGFEVEEEKLDETRRIVFGVRPCDCAGLEVMDRRYYQDPADPYYDARRRNTIIVGLACNEPPYFTCFCTSVGGSPHGTRGMDLLMTDIGDRYLAEPITENGREILRLDRASEGEIAKAQELHKRADELLERLDIDSSSMDFESRIWEDESARCIGCGICTYLCPSCSCFSLETIGSSKRGKVVRSWENCQFPAYSIEASGHNPRPNKMERVRQRLFDKFSYSFEKYGDFDCVGCGRCVDLCPVNIDVREIMLSVKERGHE